MAPDAKPLAFEPSVQDLERWLTWLAADPDRVSNPGEQPDASRGLFSLTLGDAQAPTQINTAFPWTGLPTGSVALRGSAVQLGRVGDAPWTFSETELVRATAGSLTLNLDVLAQGSVTLVSTAGAVAMTAGTQIAANGSVAISAANGISVGQIESDTRIDLYSPSGQITAAASLGQPHLSAPALSFYGYGQPWASVDAQRVLEVSAQALQVSAPSGVASRGMSADGLIYRLMDRGVGYLQFKLGDGATQRVMVSASQVQNEMGQITGGQAPAQAWQGAGSSAGLAAWVPTTASSPSAVSRYLERLTSPQASQPMLFMASSESNLLSDMAYGLSPQEEEAAMSLEPGAPLLRSTGQLLAESDWTLLPQ
jgi:hypothetical protein